MSCVSWIAKTNRISNRIEFDHTAKQTMDYVDTNQQRRVIYGRWQHARHCRETSCPLSWCPRLKRLAKVSSSEEPIIVDGQNYGPFHQVLPTENAYIMSFCRPRENASGDQEGDDEYDDQGSNDDNENSNPGPSPSAVENLIHHHNDAESKTVQKIIVPERVPLTELS